MESDPTYLVWAVLLGGLSAASLPLGAAVGLGLRPRLSLAAVLAAFGAGALIAALTLELVAPTLDAIGEPGGHGAAGFWILAVSALAGGLLFVALDRALASRGAFLRKLSTAITWFTERERERNAAMLSELCAIPLLRAMPAAQVALITRDVRVRILADEEVLFREGETADALFFVRRGRVSLDRAGREVEDLSHGAIFGELPLLAGLPRTVTATARGEVEVLELRRDDVARWRSTCPEFDAGLRHLASERLAEIRERDTERSEAERRWGEAAIEALCEGATVPTPADLRRVSEEFGGGGLAVWLGLLIDGIPESVVIGASFLGLVSGQLASGGDVAFADVVPYTLIAGLFLANFPEALSSSLAMEAQGFSRGRVLGMWLALMAITAVGAGLGFAVGDAVSHELLVAIEGLAAGAMLTTIASTMIPEAVHLSGSGSRVGLATLLGFLVAASFKLLE